MRRYGTMTERGEKGGRDWHVSKSYIRNGVRTKLPSNQHEAECYRQLEAEGWTVMKSGWPDFFCMRGNEIRLVEVKPRQQTPLKLNQGVIMRKLSKFGVKCFKWTPDGGMEQVE